jgi:hypothetical protein
MTLPIENVLPPSQQRIIRRKARERISELDEHMVNTCAHQLPPNQHRQLVRCRQLAPRKGRVGLPAGTLKGPCRKRNESEHVDRVVTEHLSAVSDRHGRFQHAVVALAESDVFRESEQGILRVRPDRTFSLHARQQADAACQPRQEESPPRHFLHFCVGMWSTHWSSGELRSRSLWS